MAWTRKERLEAVLAGELADRIPISAWRHFTEDEHDGYERWSRAMLTFSQENDWDFIKLQPRASLFCEIWGQKYGYEDYGSCVVAPCLGPLFHEKDLKRDLDGILEREIDPSIFQDSLQGVLDVLQKDSERPVFQTVFCPGAIFEMFFGGLPSGRYRETGREYGLVYAMIHYPEETRAVMQMITDALIAHVEDLKKAGCYGIFYSAAALAREGYLQREEWEQFVRFYDLQLLEAMKPMRIMLHTCGMYANPERFDSYPIDILHWADSATGNAKIETAASWLHHAIPSGGCDERLFGQGKAEQIAKTCADTIARMQGKPFILTPDCSLSTKTSPEELKAFRESVNIY